MDTVGLLGCLVFDGFSGWVYVASRFFCDVTRGLVAIAHTRFGKVQLTRKTVNFAFFLVAVALVVERGLNVSAYARKSRAQGAKCGAELQYGAAVRARLKRPSSLLP